MPEVWKDIPGYRGMYQASDWGRIRSLDHQTTDYDPRWDQMRVRRIKGRVLYTTKGKYSHVGLWDRWGKDAERCMHAVHKLVLLAFVGQCPIGMECSHKDGNGQNNKLSNIRWASRGENRRDDVLNGNIKTGSKNPQSKMDKRRGDVIRKLYATGKYSQEEIAAMFKIGQTLVSRTIRGLKGID